jgi:hypothetical protein
MTRADFIAYLTSRARELGVPLQTHGAMAGLPCKLDHALQIIEMLHGRGRPAPNRRDVRAWYRGADEEAAEPINTALAAYESLHDLRAPDLVGLDDRNLLEFWLRCKNWAHIAGSLVQGRRGGWESETDGRGTDAEGVPAAE